MRNFTLPGGFLLVAALAWPALSIAQVGNPPDSRQNLRPNRLSPKTMTDQIKRKWLDVPYAKLSAAEKLDIYLPDAGEGPFPVIMAIHGGAFAMGDKADAQLNPMLAGLNRGYAVVSVNYLLSGEARFPAQINDVKAAVRFIRANAGKYRLKADKIAAWGGSAGGHLAALTGTSGTVAELEDLDLGNPDQSSWVQAVVDWFGPIDFLKMDEQFKKSGLGRPDHSQAGSPESRLLGRQITNVPELVKAANPQMYITPDDPPFLIQHGTKDPLIPTEQSIHFGAELENVLGKEKVTLELLQGAGHGGPQFEAPDNIKKVLDFLDRHLK